MSVVVQKTAKAYEQLLGDIKQATGLLKDICNLVSELYYEENLIYHIQPSSDCLLDCFKQLQSNPDPLAREYMKMLEYTAWEVFSLTRDSLRWNPLTCFRAKCMWGAQGCHCYIVS